MKQFIVDGIVYTEPTAGMADGLIHVRPIFSLLTDEHEDMFMELDHRAEMRCSHRVDERSWLRHGALFFVETP